MPLSTPVTAEASAAQVPYPSVSESRLSSVGSSGFLVHEQGTPLWTSFTDGSITVVSEESSVSGTLASGVVKIEQWEGSRKVTELRDMSTQRSVIISPDL